MSEDGLRLKSIRIASSDMNDWIQIHSREWINPLHIEKVHISQDHPKGYWRTNISMISGKSYHVYVGRDWNEAKAQSQKVIEKLQRYLRNTFYLH